MVYASNYLTTVKQLDKIGNPKIPFIFQDTAMKICTRCNQTKQLTDFSRGKSMCKPCATMDIQERNKTPIC